MRASLLLARVLPIFLLLGSTHPVTGQVDSLRALLKGELPDTTRIRLLRDVGMTLTEQGNFTEAEGYLNEALERATRSGDETLQGRIENELGIHRYYQGDNQGALAHWERTSRTALAQGDTGYYHRVHKNMANAWMSMGDHPAAQRAYLDALRWAETHGARREVAGCLINLAALYGNQERNDTARHYLELVLREHAGDLDAFLLANVLNNLAGLDQQEGRLDDAERHGLVLLRVSQEAGLDRFVGVAQETLGIAAKARGERSKARPLFLEAIRIQREGGNDHDRAPATQRLAELDLEAAAAQDKPYFDRFFQGDQGAALSEARALIDTAMIIFKDQEDLDQLRYTYQAMSLVLEEQGDADGALAFYKQYKVLSDSLLNAERDRRLTERSMQYAFDKKEAEARADQERKDQRQRLVRNSITGGFALSLLFLCVVWRQRNRISAARKRSDELLLNILPEEVAEELKDTGAAAARHFDTATILFTDFKGFTQLSEQVSPAELVEELNSCFKVFDGIMGKYRIEKIKTIGDAYMAAGGLPDPKQGSPADVVRAALEMQDFMKHHKAEREAAAKPFFEMRVGIHSGPVVAGIVGVKKFQYDIWGDTVNTASRMESSGQVGQVNISEATYALVKNEAGLTFNPRGKVQAKGKGDMEMYFVTTT